MTTFATSKTYWKIFKMAQSLFVLFEHAVGYGLFQVSEFDEMAMLAPRVEQNVLDLSKFNSMVKNVAFNPFKSAHNALDNMNSISEGLLHEDLKVFLAANVPKSSKKLVTMLGVSDARLAAAIVEELQIKCVCTGAIPEIHRGLRLHFSSMVKEGRLTALAASKAQLGLGHSYSRAKVKFNVNRVDNMIIQSIALLDQLDKDINTFSMRIREWYSYHFPELVKVVPDNYMFAKAVRVIKDRKQITPETLEALEEVVMDSAKVQAVVDCARSSMGMDISPLDLINIETFASRVIALAEYRQKLAQYLVNKMQAVAPNLASLIGEQVAARLIAHAGSLTNLAKYPASTVQILGAEKALFRALKTKGNTPKYGLIFHSTFIGRAAAKNKGRISRYLANKCSIASRIDCFSDTPCQLYGDFLRQQVEDRLKFYETGECPAKNIDIMRQAVTAATELQAKMAKKEKKKKKKENEADTSQADTTMEVDTPKKKKKNKKKAQEESEEEEEVEAETPKKKKKDKKRKSEEINSTMESLNGDEEEPKKKKKKKTEVDMEVNGEGMDGGDSPSKKDKKKKRKSKGGDE